MVAASESLHDNLLVLNPIVGAEIKKPVWHALVDLFLAGHRLLLCVEPIRTLRGSELVVQPIS